MSSILDTIADSHIRRFPNDSAFFYRAGFCVNADGARHAYHPEKGKGLDYLANAGNPGDWWGIVTDDNGNPLVQSNGYYISTTSLVDGSKSKEDPERYVDSETVPFIVLPVGNNFGAKLGDYCYVYNTNKGIGAGAIFADGGPPNKIGEGSIALAKLLQIPESPKNGGCNDGIIWVVFPSSRDNSIFPIDLVKLQAKATKFFQSWGGTSRLSLEFPKLLFVNKPNYTSISDIANIEPMELTLSQTPIGQLKISTKTWIKTSTAASSTLPASNKVERLPSEQPIPIFKRMADKDNHYQVVIKVNGELKPVFVYSLHAGIEMFADSVSDSLELEPLPAIEKLPEKETTISIDPSDKKAIQLQLIRVGTLDGPADGKWGSLSASALRAFKRAAMGADDDSIDTATVEALVKFKSAKTLDFKPKDSSDLENVLAVKLIKRMVELGMPINVSMGSSSATYNIVYVSGTNPDGTKNNNRIDDWNDLRFLIQVAQDGTVIKALCKEATIDAGQHWRDNPMNSLGTAQIEMDQYLTACHAKGRHGSRQYPALVQVGMIKITRDLNAKGLRDAADKHYEGDDYGMNQHHGYDSPYNRVGVMSAGCLVGRTVAGHELFMSLLEKDRRYLCNNGFAWSTAVLDGSKI